MQDEKEKINPIKMHISEETWKAFADNTLPSADYCRLLEHTGRCIWCAERMAQIMEQGPMAILPPAYLKEQIRDRTKQFSVQSAAPVERISGRMRLILYSLKVGGAVVMALLVLFFTGVAQQNNGVYSDAGLWQEWESDWAETAEESTTNLFLGAVGQAADDVTAQINVFADKLLKWNVVEDGGQ